MRKRGPMTCETKNDLRKKIEELQTEVRNLKNGVRISEEHQFMPSGMIENVCIQLLEQGKMEPRAKFKTEPEQYLGPEMLLKTIEAFCQGDYDEYGDVKVNFTIRHY